MEAAVLASVPQVLLPKLEEHLFLPHHEDADLGPRVIERAAELAEKRLPEDMKWLGASAFHFGYAMAWGAAYAVAYEKKPVEPWLGGVALSALIYGMTFPAWGLAVLSGSEDHPRKRTWRKEVILATAPIVFGMGTALIYGRGPGRTFLERVREAWRETRS
jgi:hypothetical protein